jgi:hypothetical protein
MKNFIKSGNRDIITIEEIRRVAMNIFTRIIELIFGTKQQRDVKKFKP